MRWPGGVTLFALAGFPAAFASAAPPAPSQPVPFSHRVHVGVNQAGCLMCHAYAEHSPVAGIPSMARCFGCHKFIGRDKPAVQLVLKTYADGRVIEWNRVYQLPDHVFFTHERHLAAKLRCQQCHGPVETLDEIRLAGPLTMGWCVDCHRERRAPRDCLTCHK
jgi:hypothetical protein